MRKGLRMRFYYVLAGVLCAAVQISTTFTRAIKPLLESLSSLLSYLEDMELSLLAAHSVLFGGGFKRDVHALYHMQRPARDVIG